MRFCGDCQHYRPYIGSLSEVEYPSMTGRERWATCAIRVVPNPINGKTEPAYCLVARQPGEPCGPDGDRWEPEGG